MHFFFYKQLDDRLRTSDMVRTDNTHVQAHLTPVAMPTTCHILDPSCSIKTGHGETWALLGDGVMSPTRAIQMQTL